MEIRARHWLLALTVAGAAHGSLLLLPSQSVSRPTPPPVYRIVLAETQPPEPASGGAPGAPGAAEAGSPPVQEPAASPPASVAVAPPSAPTEPLKAPKREPIESKPAPKAKPRPKVTKHAPPKETKRPVKTRKARPKPSPAEAPARAPLRPAIKADASGKPTGSAPSTATARRGGSGLAATPGRAPSPGQGRAGSGGASGKGGGQGSSAVSARGYYSTLAAWLARHKRYPEPARRRQEQGTVRVTFTIDRQGRLLSHRIAASSGHPLLDQEVKALVQRASPMPPIPAALGKSSLTITVPISFTLR